MAQVEICHEASWSTDRVYTYRLGLNRILLPYSIWLIPVPIKGIRRCYRDYQSVLVGVLVCMPACQTTNPPARQLIQTCRWTASFVVAIKVADCHTCTHQ